MMFKRSKPLDYAADKRFSVSHENITMENKTIAQPFILLVHENQFNDKDSIPANFSRVRALTYRTVIKPGVTALSEHAFLQSLKNIKCAPDIKKRYENYKFMLSDGIHQEPRFSKK